MMSRCCFPSGWGWRSQSSGRAGAVAVRADGGVVVAGVRGRLWSGVDLLNMRRTGVLAEIRDTKLRRVVGGTSSCTGCLDGVGRGAGAIRLRTVKACFNVDPFHAFTVATETAAAVI
eukprot:TRINITY_DN18120_c0_g1_i1.p5 TRINITY_DN18120_c0_g1~~TRINITY_DN18120_c0_g1_i1.p5  ORF type:complete len:117 (+),score=0.43 TRINITY_DN18120_c0_g1_i1:450-800(+)